VADKKFSKKFALFLKILNFVFGLSSQELNSKDVAKATLCDNTKKAKVLILFDSLSLF